MTEPKYRIGDRIAETNIYVRGIALLSTEKYRYFVQVKDNTLVTDINGIETAIELLQPGFSEELALDNNYLIR